ncbi:hypothetical protein A3L04_03255 [Thermococcus chitonophagus]|uniref:Uncharacterized protein n=1 Tax=Thermococcus chitonophagus TaxID=54262 RepID=A0A170SYX5_9EURY|nr:hypothetical protein [Thermococcus chitonophagus]ASJ16165.1 hypothetical protein A3L04_03255 [Thermococcus chitonophagus]CUX78866.1 hypothetical protein CHITON_2087 [Thermococcus chitonophagus]
MFNLGTSDVIGAGIVGVTLSLVMMLILFISKIIKKEYLDIGEPLRISSIVLVVSLALIAHTELIYFISIIIIATSITKLEFLLNLVAILRGGEGASKYFDTLQKIPYASSQEIQEKEIRKREELQDESKIDRGSIQIKHVEKIPPYVIEELAIRELERKYNSIAKREVKIGKYVVDAIMPLDDKTDAIVEIKIKPLPPEFILKTIKHLEAARKLYERIYKRNSVILLGIVGATPEYIRNLKQIIDQKTTSKIPLKIEAVSINTELSGQ